MEGVSGTNSLGSLGRKWNLDHVLNTVNSVTKTNESGGFSIPGTLQGENSAAGLGTLAGVTKTLSQGRKSNVGRAINTGANYLKAYQLREIDKAQGGSPGVADLAFMAALPSHYSAFKAIKVSDKTSPFGRLAALIMPRRYAAYKLAKMNGEKLGLLKTIGILLAPNEYGALEATRKRMELKPGEFTALA